MRPAFSREHPATGVQSRFLLGQETDSSTPEGHLSPPGPTEEDRETDDLGWSVSTANRQLGGVCGPGRKLSACSMLKEVMERLVGGRRETPAAEDDDDDEED